jgi:hypothetical protein
MDIVIGADESNRGAGCAWLGAIGAGKARDTRAKDEEEVEGSDAYRRTMGRDGGGAASNGAELATPLASACCCC